MKKTPLKAFRELLGKFSAWFFDWLFPTENRIKTIERISPALFLQSAKKAPPIGSVPASLSIPITYIALFSYRDPLVRQAIWQLKYAGNKTIARLFAAIIKTRFEKYKGAIFIPLPNSRQRHKERGWNQTELVAENLRENFDVRADILQKIRHTPPQADLSRQERLKNLAGCFVLAETEKIEMRRFQGKPIVLFDDVLTTGSTFYEAAKVIAATNPSEIICIALAH